MSVKTLEGGLKVVRTLRDFKPLKKVGDFSYREEWLKKMEFLDSVSAHNPAVVFLYDAALSNFIYMNDPAKILGNYDPADFTCETGQDFSFSNIHEQQRSAAMLVLLKTITYCIEHPFSCQNNLVSHMTFLYKKKNGQYIQFLQKSMVVETDASGHPLLYLRYGYDISHLVKPSVGLIINAADETLIWNYNTNKRCLEQINLMSSHEKKILALLAEGRQSKDIADMLYISPHTIDTHRRNLLKKTNCIDTTAMITFAKMTGLI